MNGQELMALFAGIVSLATQVIDTKNAKIAELQAKLVEVTGELVATQAQLADAIAQINTLKAEQETAAVVLAGVQTQLVAVTEAKAKAEAELVVLGEYKSADMAEDVELKASFESFQASLNQQLAA